MHVVDTTTEQKRPRVPNPQSDIKEICAWMLDAWFSALLVVKGSETTFYSLKEFIVI